MDNVADSTMCSCPCHLIFGSKNENFVSHMGPSTSALELSCGSGIKQLCFDRILPSSPVLRLSFCPSVSPDAFHRPCSAVRYLAQALRALTTPATVPLFIKVIRKPQRIKARSCRAKWKRRLLAAHPYVY